MGNRSSSMLQDEEITLISEETGFSGAQIERLYLRFRSLDSSSCGSLSKEDFLKVPELAINPLCDRIVHIFFADCEEEHDRINFKRFMRVLATFRSSAKTNWTNKASRQESANDDFVHHNLKRPSEQAIRARHLARHARNNGSTIQIAPKIDRELLAKFDWLTESLGHKLLFVYRVYDADNDGRISFQDLKSILKMIVGNYIEDVQLDKIASRTMFEVDEDGDGFIQFGEFCKVFHGKDLDDKWRVKFFS